MLGSQVLPPNMSEASDAASTASSGAVVPVPRLGILPVHMLLFCLFAVQVVAGHMCVGSALARRDRSSEYERHRAMRSLLTRPDSDEVGAQQPRRLQSTGKKGLR